MARQDGNALILQLPGEVLFRIWSSLEEEDAGPSREAWRLVCSHFNKCVFKHCKRLAWRRRRPRHGSPADSCLRALLHKFAVAGDGSGLAQLRLNGLQLQEEHCKALSEGVVSGKLRCLTTLQAPFDSPIGTAAQLFLKLVLSHCRQLTTFTIQGDQQQNAICPVCEMLQAVPAPVEPFRGLQVLRLQNWLFGTSQLTALRDALVNNLPTLTELNLGEWGFESDRRINEGLLVDVVGAALASGNLRVLYLGRRPTYQLQPEHQERLSQRLQSHRCTLTTLSLWGTMLSPQHLASVLQRNQRLQSLHLTPVQVGDSDLGSSSGVTQLGAALGQLTRLTALWAVFGQEDLEPLIGGLAHFSALQELGITGQPSNGGLQRLTARNLQHLAAALGNMQQLRELHMVHVLGLSMSGACALLRSLPPQHLTNLHLDAIDAHSGMPAGEAEALALGPALQRLTSLQQLTLNDLATDAGDAEHMGAAAAVASALPHLPHLTHACFDSIFSEGGSGELTRFGRRAAALSILSSACLSPSLEYLRLERFLQGNDQVKAQQMVQRIMPHIQVVFL